MKLLFITEFFPTSDKSKFTGGVETRTFFVVKNLKKNNQVDVISRPQTHVAATTTSIIPRLTFQITSIFKAQSKKADVIEGSNFITYLPTFMAAKLSGAKAVALRFNLV